MPRSLLNLSKNGRTVDENRRSSNRSLKYKKSITAASCKSNSNTKNHDRLVGGADVPVETEDASATKEITEEISVVVEVTDETETTKTQNEQISIPLGGPCCSCLSQVPGSTGDKKVDEMIDYVHQNLQEAGKALATLSENFEHESKLMFADVLGRIQHWAALVQNKLDLCKMDIEALRKELMARACEIANLRKLLADCEAREAKALSEKQVISTQITPPVQQEVPLQTQVQEPEIQVPTNQPNQPEVQRPTIVEDDENIDEPVYRMEHKPKADEDKPETEDGPKATTVEIVCTDAAIQSILKDKDRMRRELELEAEITRLRKENERIIKERAEYENAIQRALLRGVSCLNVEALRVLRCPPIPCCSPCAPCPASTMKSNTSCKKEGLSMPKGCVTQQRIGSGKSAVRQANSYIVKRPCASPCCPAGKSRKSVSSSSMVFLLHQDDTENICDSKITKAPPVCGSPTMKKIEIPPCPRFTR